jgi:RHS repeat-associated protein
VIIRQARRRLPIPGFQRKPVGRWARGHGVGSTAITANSSGGWSAELRYKPWGETRYTSGSTPTRRQYTGQINDSEMGLYFYGARYYSPLLGRFVSADTIVPDEKNPQNLNRFSYVQNNPLRPIDPSGHRCLDNKTGTKPVRCDPKPRKIPSSRDLKSDR